MCLTIILGSNLTRSKVLHKHWDDFHKGKWIFTLIPNIQPWMIWHHQDVRYHLTWFFGWYLHRFGCHDSPCPACSIDYEASITCTFLVSEIYYKNCSTFKCLFRKFLCPKENRIKQEHSDISPEGASNCRVPTKKQMRRGDILALLVRVEEDSCPILWKIVDEKKWFNWVKIPRCILKKLIIFPWYSLYVKRMSAYRNISNNFYTKKHMFRFKFSSKNSNYANDIGITSYRGIDLNHQLR